MKHYNFSAFLHRSTESIRANIHSEKRLFVIKRACTLLNKFDTYFQHQAISKWCKEFRLSERALKEYIAGNERVEFSNTERLREFLGQFNILENEISGQLDIERNGIQYTYDELTILIEDEGIHTYNLKKFLKSSNKNITVVNVVNPLQKLFEELAEQYNGIPVIHKLASCITAFDFGDKEPGHYQKRLEYYLHKWLCKAAGQAMHIDKNDAMLLWIEPLGGSGKSQINQWLFSMPEMNEYYMKIGENEPFQDMKSISKSKFAIDFDELPLSQKRYLAFKSHISANKGQQYSKLSKSYETYIRQVNFIGSTNKANREKQKGFLLDDDSAMMRRILGIEIDGQIDYKKYLEEIDLRQLWGQAACDIINAQKNGNKNLLTWECDWDELRFQNKRYINRSAEDPKLILSMFPSASKENGRLLQAQQILDELRARGARFYMNEMELGHFLVKHGYEKGRVNRIRGYWIK